MSRGMFAAANVKINVVPVVYGFLGDKLCFVVRVFITQVIPAAAGPAGHGGGFKREGLNPLPLLQRRRGVGPVLGPRQWRFTRFGGKIFVHFRKNDRQIFFLYGFRNSVLIIDWNRFAPVALPPENGI